MTNKDIQTERLLRYFLDAAKNIIKSEGIDALTVRSVADKAGYSYGTLYNYYKDVKDLIHQSGIEFMGECKEYVAGIQYPENEPIEIIKLKSGKYIEFFVQYTGIYNLLYISGKNSIGKFREFNQALIEMNTEIFGNEFKQIFGNKSNEMLAMFMTLVSGSLLLYINRMYPEEYTDFRKSLNFQMDMLLNSGK